MGKDTPSNEPRYVDIGEGDPPIILLPGGSLNSSYLKPLAKKLADAGHRVVRVDSVKHDEDSVTMHVLAKDVIDVVNELGLGKCWIAGHAFGNRVARAVALDYPQQVEGVILLAAGGTVAPSEGATEALKIAFSDVSEAEAEKAMEYMVGDPKEAKPAWEAIKAARDPSLGAEQRQANLATPPDEWARIAHGTRAIIIQGSNDQMAPPANGEQLAKENPDNTTLLSIEGAGHLFAFIHPDATAKLILDNI